MKRTKFACCISMLVMLAVFCVGCGKSASDAGNMSASKNETEVSADTTVDEEVSGEDTNNDEAVEENVEESEPAFVIPDYDYDDYLTVSETDNTPVLGFNIPAGWERLNTSNTQRTLQKIGYSEDVDYDYGKQHIYIRYGEDAIKQLNAIATGEKPEYIEQDDVETPIGTFKTYVEQRDERAYTEYAFLPIDDTNGVYIFYAYTKEIRVHFYENGMPALLTTLFNEKQENVPLSDSYEYYLESYTYDGQTILGVNIPEGYHDDYSEPTRLSFKSDSGNRISITEDPFLSPIYREATNIHLSAGIYNPDIQDIYTYKNSIETPYGTVKIFDRKDVMPPDTNYFESAIIAYNGYFIEIELNNYDTWKNGYYNELESLLAQMF